MDRLMTDCLRIWVFFLLFGLGTWSCRAPKDELPTEAGAPASEEPSAADDDAPIPPPPEPEPLPVGLAPFVEPWKGDLDGMIERRVIRVLVVQSPVLYFVDKGRELGLTYEAVKGFETYLNEALGTGHLKVHVLPMPVARDELVPRLLAGQGDIAAALLTITPARREQVEFSDPLGRDVNEIVVTGTSHDPLEDVDDLIGKEIHVRASSSYHEHLETLNARFAELGREPVRIVSADETLEDGDLLEMVNAGLIPATVVDDYLADLWAQVFPDLRLHRDAAVSSGNEVAWAFRKGSPKLAEAVNAYVKTSKRGTLSGNILIKRYLRSTKWLTNVRSEEDMARFRSMIDLFKRYASQYDFDWLLMVAQGYQESTLDQSKRSPAGAIGVMQLMPETARDKAIGIADIENLESNIHAGIKYNRWIVDHFFDEPEISRRDRALFAFASYNAGPSRISRLRKEAEAEGLDPNRWFNNVELIAAKRIGRETVQYVSNIYKYYLAYQMVMREQERRQRRS